MFFYFSLISNVNSGRVKNPNDPTCEKTNTQIDILEKNPIKKEKTKNIHIV